MALGNANPERVKVPTTAMYLDLRDYWSGEFDNDFPLRILRTANDEIVSSGLWQRRSIKFPRAQNRESVLSQELNRMDV